MFTGFHFGAWRQVKAITSAVSFSEGPGGKICVPRERYSLRMSFCVVPESAARGTPRRSAVAT